VRGNVVGSFHTINRGGRRGSTVWQKRRNGEREREREGERERERKGEKKKKTGAEALLADAARTGLAAYDLSRIVTIE